jgi:hypothetical protein
MAERNPVPPAMKDDAEDVSWALSTAEAMWTPRERPLVPPLERLADTPHDVAAELAHFVFELPRADVVGIVRITYGRDRADVLERHGRGMLEDAHGTPGGE